MTALTYICLFVGAWRLACGVLRLVDKLEDHKVHRPANSKGVGADDSVRPNDNRSAHDRADRVVGPYGRKAGAK